jgi:hypothetical protein
MRANPDLLLYAGSPQFEPQGGTIIGGSYGGVFAAPARNNPYTQHGVGRFVSFTDDLAGDDLSTPMGFLSNLGKGFIVLSVMGVAAVLLSPKN